MKIIWEEIYNNSCITHFDFQVTYRAKVIGGWLIRHETRNDYQYACSHSCEDNPSNPHGHISEEGYQDIRNVITFLPDVDHNWDDSNDIMEGAI